MLDLTKPVRHRGNNLKVRLLGQLAKADDFSGRRMLVVVTTDPTDSSERVAYREIDGRHPNGLAHFDLVYFDKSKAASLYQTMDPKLAEALKVLWRAEQWGPALDVMVGLDGTLDVADVRHYFEGLFGA
jgi:hypothetical protein